MSNARSQAGVPGRPAAFARVRASNRNSPTVAHPSFQNVWANWSSETLSPNHWCMFSWYRVSRSIRPPSNVILPCISSSNDALGRPITTPSVVNGNGPSNMASNRVMSGCWFMIARLRAFRPGLIELACAS